MTGRRIWDAEESRSIEIIWPGNKKCAFLSLLEEDRVGEWEELWVGALPLSCGLGSATIVQLCSV